MRRLGHKPILAITAVVAAVTAVTFAASPAAQADIETHSGSVDITSLPGSAPVVLDQFDPSLGTLTQLTVTATLAGSITRWWRTSRRWRATRRWRSPHRPTPPALARSPCT